MENRTIAVAGIVLLAVLVAGWAQGRTDARVDGLALRLDSLAVTLTDVVTAVQQARSGPSAAPAADTLRIDAPGPFRGSPTAPVTLVEFIDYECPFCRRFHTETLPVLLEEYVDTGRLRIVLRDQPLPSHPNALPAARTARCVAEQGERLYWQYSDALLAVRGPLDDVIVKATAADVGADVAALEQCIASGRRDDAIATDTRAAAEAGLTGTPSFIIGPTGPDGTVRGRVIRGAYPTDVFRDAIEGALNAAEADEIPLAADMSTAQEADA